MKIDRLIGITMYLMNRDTISAATLAQRFEVSKRTIQRDIDTLSIAGIPIVSTYGSDGGYEIMDGFKLTKQIAGVDDYLNIIIALKGLISAYDNPKINSTLEKALTTIQGAEQQIFVDFTVARENVQVNERLKVIEKAIYEKTPLLIQLCKKEIRQQILEYLNPNIIEEHSDGNFTAELNVPFERMWFSLLLGFGNQVEVIEPQELKIMLKQKAEEILSIY